MRPTRSALGLEAKEQPASQGTDTRRKAADKIYPEDEVFRHTRAPDGAATPKRFSILEKHSDDVEKASEPAHAVSGQLRVRGKYVFVAR